MVYASRGSSGFENFEMKFVRKHNKIILLEESEVRRMANLKKRKIRKAIARLAIAVEKHQVDKCMEKHLRTSWNYKIIVMEEITMGLGNQSIEGLPCFKN